VSDESYEELHVFTERLGLRRMGFQGDHYDVSADHREKALALGAQACPGRDLVRRLRAAGLRLGPAERPGKWEPVLGVEMPSAEVSGAEQELVSELLNCLSTEGPMKVESFSRRGEFALVVECPQGMDLNRSLPQGVLYRFTDAGRRLELLSEI
jgi:hypothetical protein